ncbi:MAG TPA: hypothetical protein VMM60_02575 [Ilumatobacter sp.]|nr:hypothetical protein [Ilumatobacter sp.]
MADVGSAPTSRVPWRPSDIQVAVTVVAVGSLLIIATGVRGGDYPAQLLRAELFDQAGFTVWNNYWYAGHPTLTYSLIGPPLMSVFGTLTVCIAASLAATACFTSVVRAGLPEVSARWAGAVFACAALVNVVVGRVTFALGLAVGLAAVWAWHRGWLAAAVVLAFVTPLASPVAATFLGIAAGSICCDAFWPRAGTSAEAGTGVATRLRTAGPSLAVGAAAVAPLLLMAVLFASDGGTFPFRGGHFLVSLLVMMFAWSVVPHRVVRIGLVVSALASVIVFVVPSPLGGNFMRLAQFIVVPLAVAGAVHVPSGTRRSRRAVLIGMAAFCAGWTVQHAVVSAALWAGDPSTERAYHQPLIDEVLTRNGDGKPLGRLEIPFTANHWEAYYVADQVPFIRGWERQIDHDRNGVLYEPSLTADEYREWLLHNTVRWIALPDAPLDRGGEPEANVLTNRGDRTGPVDWLSVVWQNEHWTLYEVEDYQPIVDAPATLLSQTPDEFIIATTEATTVTLRYEWANGATIELMPVGTTDETTDETTGQPCLAPTDDEWISVQLPAAGTYRIQVGRDSLLPGAGTNGSCD